MGSREADKKYKQKRYESDKVFSQLYRGEGGKDHESFGDFKSGLKSLFSYSLFK